MKATKQKKSIFAQRNLFFSSSFVKRDFFWLSFVVFFSDMVTRFEIANNVTLPQHSKNIKLPASCSRKSATTQLLVLVQTKTCEYCHISFNEMVGSIVLNTDRFTIFRPQCSFLREKSCHIQK